MLISIFLGHFNAFVLSGVVTAVPVPVRSDWFPVRRAPRHELDLPYEDRRTIQLLRSNQNFNPENSWWAKTYAIPPTFHWDRQGKNDSETKSGAFSKKLKVKQLEIRLIPGL